MKRALREVAEFLGASLVGDGGGEVTGIASLQSAGPGDLVFVEDKKNLARALSSKAAAVIAGEFASNGQHSKPVLVTAQPRLAFARAGAWLQSPEQITTVPHPSAVVHPKANIAKNVSIEERVVIREQVSIGEGTRIGAGCVVGPKVTIGR
ncbi:MAG TPA: LpxD N-terminal domain-containing protein, partial [Terriglobales bacterium]|nr:LpxD N-terminal domain-containing protein [Terriglobales bacterium]